MGDLKVACAMLFSLGITAAVVYIMVSKLFWVVSV